MNSLLLMVITFLGYIVAYQFYGKFIGHKIFQLTNKNKMPAHEFEDGVDFVPTKKHIVLGHHFTTIAGTGPIVGPAIGIIWGWGPALLWIFFGSIFMGAVHDFSALVISARNQGRTLGDLTGNLISPSTKYAFQFIIQFLLWIVLAIFAMIMGILFVKYPQSVFPVWMEIPIAIWLGYEIKKGKSDTLYSIIAVVLMYFTIFLGLYMPISLPGSANAQIITWAVILFAYVFIASTLPVQTLLQPRDYINSHELLIAMGLLVLGVVFAHPQMTAPVVNEAAKATGTDIPNLMPILFITIACGAISGFHSLAASGTTVKQVDKEEDTLAIGYGGMILEGVLATIILIAIGGGLGMGLAGKDGALLTGPAAYASHYASWAGAAGLGAKLEAVVVGAANLMTSIGIPKDLGMSIMAVFIVSFAGTTLDSATRIQRFSFQEIMKKKNGKVMKPFDNRFVSTGIVVILAAILTFLQPGGKGALILWPMFGALNQLLAALALLIATVYLSSKGKNILVTFIPMLFMLIMTIWAMFINLNKFIGMKNGLLITLSIIIMLLTAWLLIGAFIALAKNLKNREVVIEEEE